MTKVIALVPDLMFATRIVDTAKHLGYPIEILNRASDADATITNTSLAIVALDAPEWEHVVTLAKQAGARVLAFGSHKNVEQMQAAKRAGCDQVVARSLMAAELPNLLRKLIAG